MKLWLLPSGKALLDILKSGVIQLAGWLGSFNLLDELIILAKCCLTVSRLKEPLSISSISVEVLAGLFSIVHYN